MTRIMFGMRLAMLSSRAQMIASSCHCAPPENATDRAFRGVLLAAALCASGEIIARIDHPRR